MTYRGLPYTNVKVNNFKWPNTSLGKIVAHSKNAWVFSVTLKVGLL